MMLWAVKYFWAPKMRALCGRMPLGLGLPPRMSRGHADGVMVLAASVFNSSCSLSSNPNFLHYILTSYSLSPITFCLKQHLHCCTRINTWNNVQAHRSRNITHMNVLHQYQNRLQYHVSNQYATTTIKFKHATTSVSTSTCISLCNENLNINHFLAHMISHSKWIWRWVWNHW